MRLGIFGGSFDPIHLGHLILAEQCREQAQLDRVWFLPAARPPHKLTQPLTPFHHRLEMVELAIAGYPPFAVSTLERDRPGPSFTADTLRQLREEHREDELFLILGSDSVEDLPKWYQPETIAALATLLIVGRPGTTAAVPPSGFRWQSITSPLIEIASSDLRLRVARGQSIRYQVPRAVEAYVEQHLLYRSSTAV